MNARFVSGALRVVLVILAWAHTFPARRHIAAFVERPSVDEAWKGFGAALAVGLYLLPLRTYARALGALWARRRTALLVAGWALAAAHAVPALDHLPRFIAAPSWADGWRGLGAATACAWFVLPVTVQARLIGTFRHAIAVEDGRMETWRLAAVVGLGLLLGAVSGVRMVSGSAPPVTHAALSDSVATPVLAVPRAAGAISVDGELDDPGWAGNVARTGAFKTAGAQARPYSDARLVHKDGVLYLVLYAADEDLRTEGEVDTFHVSFRSGATTRTIDVTAGGEVRGEARAVASVERDGTVNDPSDDDEEWVVEMAIPLEALGVVARPGERFHVSLERCDTPHARPAAPAARVCAGWSGELSLE